MPTIAILTNSISGLYSFRRELVEELVNKGCKVVISSPLQDDEKAAWFAAKGCVMEKIEIDRRGTNPIRDLKLLAKYSRLLKCYHPAAVLTYTAKPNIYGGIAAAMCNIPQLATITGLGYAIEHGGWLSRLTTMLYRIGLRNAVCVFYQNYNIEKFCKANHIGKNGRNVPGSGVNLEYNALLPCPSPEEPLRLLFVGRVMKDKGIDELLDVACRMKHEGLGVEFHLVGDCEERYESKLRQLQQEGIVMWHGRVADVRPLLATAAAIVHPSYHEGMSNVLMEAAAMGRPAVASDICGCREVVDDGVTGYLFPAGDSEELYIKLRKMVNLTWADRKAMGMAARAKMERMFDRKKVVAAYMEELGKEVPSVL